MLCIVVIWKCVFDKRVQRNSTHCIAHSAIWDLKPAWCHKWGFVASGKNTTQFNDSLSQYAMAVGNKQPHDCTDQHKTSRDCSSRCVLNSGRNACHYYGYNFNIQTANESGTQHNMYMWCKLCTIDRQILLWNIEIQAQKSSAQR